MEVRCPKCYHKKIQCGIPVMQKHSHPNTDTQITQILVDNKGLTADRCEKCGYIVRFYAK